MTKKHSYFLAIFLTALAVHMLPTQVAVAAIAKEDEVVPYPFIVDQKPTALPTPPAIAPAPIVQKPEPITEAPKNTEVKSVEVKPDPVKPESLAPLPEPKPDVAADKPNSASADINPPVLKLPPPEPVNAPKIVEAKPESDSSSQEASKTTALPAVKKPEEITTPSPIVRVVRSIIGSSDETVPEKSVAPPPPPAVLTVPPVTEPLAPVAPTVSEVVGSVKVIKPQEQVENIAESPKKSPYKPDNSNKLDKKAEKAKAKAKPKPQTAKSPATNSTDDLNRKQLEGARVGSKSAQMDANQELSRETRAAISSIESAIRKNADKQNAANKQKVEIMRDAHPTGIGEFNPMSNDMSPGMKVDVRNYEPGVSEISNQAYKALMAGQLETSISLYKKALKLNTNDLNSLLGLATAYQKGGQNLQARKVYEKLLSLYPDNLEATNNFLALVGEESPAEALAQLKRLENANPNYTPVKAQLSMLHLRLGNRSEAVRYLKEAVNLAPQNMAYRYNLAIMLDEMGDRSGASALYRQLVSEAQKGNPIPGSVSDIEQRLIYLGTK